MSCESKEGATTNTTGGVFSTCIINRLQGALSGDGNSGKWSGRTIGNVILTIVSGASTGPSGDGLKEIDFAFTLEG
jgi:hypothetical protein